MLGRTTYTREELDHARASTTAQLAAYRELASASRGEPALAAFEPLVFNAMALALDRRFVHRVRTVTGKDTNPISELELICDSLMLNDGTFRTGTVVKYVPGQAVVGLAPGDRIALTADEFERLSAAFLDHLERTCVPSAT
jgi:hypothetical protein